MIKKVKKSRTLATSQILILIIGIFAFAYAFGSEIRTVSGGIGTVSMLQIPKLTGTGGVSEPIAKFFGDIIKDIVKSFVGTEAGVGTLSYIFETAAVAFAVAAIIHYIAAQFASERNTRNIASAAYISATATTVISWGMAAAGIGPPGWMVGLAVVAFTAVWTLFTYQLYSQEIFTFQPGAWQPPDGGKSCEKCNRLEYGCSEYQCHTFGRACELVNKGTKHETCIWNNSRDITPPTVQAMENILPENYEYRDSGIILPPERGVKIFNTENDDGCIPAFSSIVLAVNTSEPAECKIDVERKPTFDEMISSLSEGNALTYNHSLTLPNSATPSVEAMKEVEWNVENGRQNQFYIRCKDANGNPTPMNFIIEFCVDDTPDTKAPKILGTTYLSGAYVGYGIKSVDLDIYTDEPATCKWDHEDLDYENMNYGMDFCSQNAMDYLLPFTYGCTGNLSGLKDKIDNKFYIRCQDKPWWTEEDEGKRYSNEEPYELILKGTRPLIIDSITINGKESGSTIKDSTTSVKINLKVRTSAGAQEGKAKCQYKLEERFYYFYNDGNSEYTYENTHNLYHSTGDYEYTIKCCDLGNNCDEKEVSFKIEADFGAPSVVRAYHSGGKLNLITSESAQCKYDTVSCTYLFEDGTSMSTSDDITHSVTWNTENTLYVKCQDEYGNQPAGCSITLRPFEFF